MRKLFSLFVALLATIPLWAYDFQSGDLYYNITSDTTVEVTYQAYDSQQNYLGLTSVTIPETVTHNSIIYSVTSIGNYAFQYCYAFFFSIPNSVTSIENFAFNSCLRLTSITIPNSVKTIGDFAFYNCHFLISVTIPNSVMSIGNDAFALCAGLSSITIPNSVTSIGSFAFGNCIFSMQNFINNSSLNEKENNYWGAEIVDQDIDGMLIRNDTIFNCRPYITSAIIPNNITCIGDFAFGDCEFLDSVIIPNSVTSIGEGAFTGCYSLTFIVIPKSITSIEEGTFAACESLTSVTIPNSITNISGYAFQDCPSLKNITIPNSVTSIGDQAFSWCFSLTSVTIPNSVTSIGDGAFDDCSSLTTITCMGTTPPEASNLGANTSICQLIVPHSAYNAYLRHTYWGQFLNIISGYLVTIQSNNDQWGKVTGAGIYTQEATITATPNEGYTFLRWSDGNTDNPRTLTVTEDITLTAEFAIEGGCLVTFMDWDGTVLSTVSVAPGEAATAPADPTREGYTFIGWDKDFSAVTDHMTVTAQYQINRYRVRFFDDDNTLLKTDSVEYLSAAVAPANPYHEGYTFTGWDKTFDSITADLDIYAQYEMGENRELTVIYTNSEDNDSEISSHSVVFKIPAAPEIEGFTFLGWKATDEFISDVITIQAIYEANAPASAPEVYVNLANPAQKLLRNGQVYILKDDKTYTIMGAEIQ